jgi:hypothetical protein
MSIQSSLYIYNFQMIIPNTWRNIFGKWRYLSQNKNIFVVPSSQEILTKDNLINRNWTRNGKCCFCDNRESIQHLLFDCLIAKIVWRIIHMTFGLAPPKNITNLFGNWLKGILKKELILVRVGVCAVIWTMWNTRNELYLANQRLSHSCRLFLWLPLDLYVLLSPTRGAATGDRFWVQSFGDSSSGFIQSVQLAAT